MNDLFDMLNIPTGNNASTERFPIGTAVRMLVKRCPDITGDAILALASLACDTRYDPVHPPYVAFVALIRRSGASFDAVKDLITETLDDIRSEHLAAQSLGEPDAEPDDDIDDDDIVVYEAHAYYDDPYSSSEHTIGLYFTEEGAIEVALDEARKDHIGDWVWCVSARIVGRNDEPKMIWSARFSDNYKSYSHALLTYGPHGQPHVHAELIPIDDDDDNQNGDNHDA